MKKILAAALASSLALSAGLAHAGGPVIVEDTAEVTESASSSVGILPILIGVVVLCAIACDGGNDNYK